MAGYFSNHSQSSRFLSNSGHHQEPNAHNHPQPPVSAQDSPRSRLPTASRHFSTEARPHADASVAPSTATVHPLRTTWVYWFRQQRAPGNKIVSYEEGIKRIAAFASVESFWSLWSHLSPPSALQPTTDYLLFHEAIKRPVWEDPLNITGGKWQVPAYLDA